MGINSIIAFQRNRQSGFQGGSDHGALASALSVCEPTRGPCLPVNPLLVQKQGWWGVLCPDSGPLVHQVASTWSAATATPIGGVLIPVSLTYHHMMHFPAVPESKAKPVVSAVFEHSRPHFDAFRANLVFPFVVLLHPRFVSFALQEHPSFLQWLRLDSCASFCLLLLPDLLHLSLRRGFFYRRHPRAPPPPPPFGGLNSEAVNSRPRKQKQQFLDIFFTPYTISPQRLSLWPTACAGCRSP